MPRPDYHRGMDDEADTKTRDKDRLSEVHARALRRFDTCATPQMEIRAHGLLCRRFISIPGAMWEGPWGDQFENSIKVEIDKLSKGVDKIVSDYRANRIVPDFRPAGGDSDQDTADTLDGIHRADSYHFKAQQARDNAFEEAAGGGFGAYRLANALADPYDTDSDEQRINPGLIITDADQRVFFDPNSKLYDKSDARFGFVLIADSRDAFEEEYADCASDWPETRLNVTYDWYAPDIVVKAEYYEVEEVREKLHILTHVLTDAEQRWWDSEIDANEIADMKARGWKVETVRRERKRVRKYLLSGAEVLEDCGFIAGNCIPIVPVYGKRWFVDNQERFRGHVSKLMDAQRIYNAKVSKLSETDSLAPREKPIFLAEQMPPHLQDLWARQEQERHPYALVNPVIDPATGQILAMGPIGTITPPQLQPVTAALLQIAGNDLAAETDDGADEVVANTSGEAMDIAATRIDAKSGLYLDNMRQSVQREGEIYLSMARDCYYEPGRVVETMSEDGDDGEAVLLEAVTDANGVHRIKNDFTTGRYKVIADVTEATATRRDKTVKSSLATAQIAMQAGDNDLAQAAILTAILNQDGEGMDKLQKYARSKAVALGLEEPNEEEQAAMEEQAQAPDPTAILAEAQAQALKASAAESMARAEKTVVEAAMAKLKPLIDGFNAETQRIKAFTTKDNPLGAEAADKLGPVVDRAASDALASPDVLPGPANDEEPPRMRIRTGRELAAG
ncbi:MAG: portal protein [Pseudomonadota bacterium]